MSKNKESGFSEYRRLTRKNMIASLKSGSITNAIDSMLMECFRISEKECDCIVEKLPDNDLSLILSVITNNKNETSFSDRRRILEILKLFFKKTS